MRWSDVLLVVSLVGGVGAMGARAQASSAPQAPAAGSQAGAPPAGATAKCNDGSFSNAKQKWQACSGHKGVQAWFADTAAGGGGRQKAAADGGGQAVAASASSGAAAPAGAAAPGGGPGMVWVNSDTKVYHCAGSKFYGKTKSGKYMTEADAKAAGDRPDRGKACGS